jgi:drug/metabolite transporter (DMT)-like permease
MTATNPKGASTKRPLLSYGLVVILSLLWGLAFVAIRRAVLELSPVSLTLLRWLIVSGAFLILAPVIGKPRSPIKKKHIPRIFLVAFASVGGYHLSLNYAETIVSSGLAGLLISFGPIFVVLLSAIFLREKISSQLLLALVLAISGALVLSINADLSFAEITGPVAVVLAAFMYAVFSVGSKPLVRDYGALPTAVWAGVLGTIFILPLMSGRFFAEVRALSLAGWLSVLYLAILSTVVANIILYTLIGTRTVSTLSVQLYLIPPVSLVGGVLILNESVTALTIVGACLLLAATALATRKRG